MIAAFDVSQFNRNGLDWRGWSRLGVREPAEVRVKGCEVLAALITGEPFAVAGKTSDRVTTFWLAGA